MDFKTALNKASSLCSRQEQCCFDIRKKLQKWNVLPDDQEKILDLLVQEKFIDESRFATSYVRDKFRFNNWGREKIRWQLKQKGISNENIDHALAQIDEDEYKKTLSSLLKKKKEQLKNTEFNKVKAALIRNAVSKGFEMDIIFPIVEQLLLKNQKN
ncbi:regulatory protein RecX [Thermophagus xiamenensis]|jgi:regulatory protein|uniref:Regulatory protein RecX n=1 Tax=Thermophagus xiamenensis TaxID=385682 RepID=A0A1I1UN46_9BACT|nr:regulatory protein RecX [Thermophagus xiamenensis]SFD72159.1 regulatory protein [Thermophagus xiamenensis]